MKTREYDIPRDFLPRLKADLEKTLESYNQISDLRRRKMELDLEQIRVYLKILEDRSDTVLLKKKNEKQIKRLLAWKAKSGAKSTPYRRQQDNLEDHFLDLQKILVSLISKRFEY